MRWDWTYETGRFVLRPRPLPAGVADAGFAALAPHPRPKEASFAEEAASAEQVHGVGVAVVDGAGTAAGCDALVTRRPGLRLLIRTADCVPLILSDPAGCLAVVHAGWRGLVEGVVEAALARFEDPERVRALIGPTIGPCCFEVGDEVATRFPDPVVRRTARGARPRVDLPREVRDRLEAVGVRSGAIDDCGVCTRCHQHLLPSHRGSGGRAGRLLAFAALLPVPRAHEA